MTEEKKEIFLYIGSNQYGPFSENEVIQNIKDGHVTREALIWDSLLANWVKITDVIRFSRLMDSGTGQAPSGLPGKPNLGTLIDFSSEKLAGHITRFIRLKKMLDITYCIIDPSTKQPVSDYHNTFTLNVSGSGLAFREASAPITPGVTVDIQIKFPKIAHPFRIFGEVVRTTEMKDNQGFEIGIKFIDLSETMQKHLLYYLQTMLTESQATPVKKS